MITIEKLALYAQKLFYTVDILEVLILVNDLDAVLILLGRWSVPNTCEMTIDSHNRGSC